MSLRICLTKVQQLTGFLGRSKLTLHYPGIRSTLHDAFYGHDYSQLEDDESVENIEEVIYIKSRWTEFSAKYEGELTHLLLQHRKYPLDKSNWFLLQVLVQIGGMQAYLRENY